MDGDGQVTRVNGVVVLDFAQLAAAKPGDLNKAIDDAFGSGPECLGILFVKNVPGYVEKRKRLLPTASQFGGLSEEKKAKYVRPPFYSFGWSHGKEIFNGKPDVAKGSFYNNPQYDEQSADEKNVWPEGNDCPELEPAFKDLGRLIVSVGEKVAEHCDAYVQSVQANVKPVMSDTIRTSRACKARLLHYFAQNSAGDKLSDEPASWCGWHLDHGSLTGLTSAMYMKSDLVEIPSPDPAAGLYIRNRKGDLVKAVIPADHLAFQLGQSSQIASGGLLRATWHSVQAAAGEAAIGVARNTFAVFMQPSNEYVFEPPADASEADIDTAEYQRGMTFAQFADAVLKKYYN